MATEPDTEPGRALAAIGWRAKGTGGALPAAIGTELLLPGRDTGVYWGGGMNGPPGVIDAGEITGGKSVTILGGIAL